MQYRSLERADLNENFAYLSKILSGDFKIVLSRTTAAPTAAAAAAGASYTIGVRLEDAAGNLHEWYNGKIKLAVSDTSNVSGAVFTIDPIAGEHNMTKGTLEVEVTMAKVTWVAGDTATLTVTTPTTAGAGICGWAASATFVATVGA